MSRLNEQLRAMGRQIETMERDAGEMRQALDRLRAVVLDIRGRPDCEALATPREIVEAAAEYLEGVRDWLDAMRRSVL